jgi:diketogulonate reductase-like aldo/keto reductase
MEPDIKEVLAEHFNALPKIVQDSITSSHVQEKLQNIAKKHSLHLDQWIPLENEIMMVLLGIQPMENMAANIAQETGATTEMAAAIAEDASDLIFEPIRQELERELNNPNAQPLEATPEESARQAALDTAHAADAREDGDRPQSIHSAPSSVRTTIEGDPYREALK